MSVFVMSSTMQHHIEQDTVRQKLFCETLLLTGANVLPIVIEDV